MQDLRTLLRLFTALLAAPLLAQSVHYELRIADAEQRLAEVAATFPAAGKDTVELFLPVWSPGFYHVEAYSEQVVDFGATAAGRSCDVTQPQPNRWRIVTAGAGEVRATYRLRCARGSVTQNQIAPAFAVFCGPATFVGEVGAPARTHTVQVHLPDGWNHVATGLPAAPDGPAHCFVARDYDWLLDSPIVLGTIATTKFDVLGAAHEWAAFGDAGDWDAAQFVQKFQPVAAELCRTFGAVPFARYVFLAGFRNANGGLEHLDSTLLSVSRRTRPDDPGFLSFVAHEYAHAFNVKRLRPVELGPFDYEKPPTTPSLWIAEGLTTWFGDLALARGGAIPRPAWLDLVSGRVRSLQGAAGRKRQTLADASLSVWKGSMSGTGGDPRTTISYYVKGPVVGFVLEARVRTATAGAHGLDEVVRRAYARYSGARGFTAAQFEEVAAEVAGASQQEFFDRALRSCDELDYGEALAWFGLRFQAAADDAPRQSRWRLEVLPDATAAQQQHLDVLLAPTSDKTLAK
jgi:predicted metalloprotease with PDZ domain